MRQKRVAVVGYGNVGRSAVAAVESAPDMRLAGLIRRKAERPDELTEGVPVLSTLKDLPEVDAAVLAIPTRQVTDYASEYLQAGICTADSYDLHGQDMVEHVQELNHCARAGDAAAVTGAGWDPGIDSVVRMLMWAMASRGLMHTNFGPGISLGHSTACRNITGVRDAVSYTIPVGSGVHRREVYIQLEPDADLSSVRREIEEDPYFARDDTVIRAVEDVDEVMDLGHGGCVEHRGSSADAHNTTVQFKLRGTNPAVTAEVMVHGIRAAMRMSPGAYTLADVPPVYLLPGEREDHIRDLM